MTMTQTMAPAPRPTQVPPALASDPIRLLRAIARRRHDRAAQLRAWSTETHPQLGGPLRRRAAELELGATALALRADGLEAARLVGAVQEEQR